MKKKSYIILGVLLCVGIVCILLFSNNRVRLNSIKTGQAVWIGNEKQLEVCLSDDDTVFVTNMFRNKVLIFDSPSCGFGDSFRIVLESEEGQQTFYIAQDSCGLVYWVNRQLFFALSDEENQVLRNMLIDHYGFECRK